MKLELLFEQETAAGTFEYGYECARAALLVEKSGGSPTPSDSHKLISKLEDTWKMFMQGSQEQLTRLRVAGIFFRTMEQVYSIYFKISNLQIVFIWQHLNRLDNLINSVKYKSISNKRKLLCDEEGRGLLSARDRLLREIGRNVRLGKLLKERLNESLVPFFK